MEALGNFDAVPVISNIHTKFLQAVIFVTQSFAKGYFFNPSVLKFPNFDFVTVSIKLNDTNCTTKSFNTVTAFTLGGTMVGALMAAYRASKLAAYAIL